VLKLQTVIAIALLAFTTSGALADRIVPISGTHSRGEIKSTCAKEGGSYSEVGLDSTYGCSKQCSGGTCRVACDKSGKCVGDIPRFLPPSRSLGAILGPPAATRTARLPAPTPKPVCPLVHGVPKCTVFGRSTGPTNPNGSDVPMLPGKRKPPSRLPMVAGRK